MYLPVAASMPALRAALSPALACEMSRMRGSAAAYFRRIAAEPSVEPSSTQMISRSFSVCLNTESRHSPRYFSTLYTGITTETFGMAHLSWNYGVSLTLRYSSLSAIRLSMALSMAHGLPVSMSTQWVYIR